MVDPYATKIGGFTAVINSERFVLEHTESNAILSLHPAFTLEGRSTASKFEEVEGFRTSENRLEVEWKPIDGVGAVTVLEMNSSDAGAYWFSVAVAFRNRSDAVIELAQGHPLFIPVEGPGALALGHRELLGLAQGGEDGRYYMIRVDGDALSSERLAVFFAPGGDPAVVVGAPDGESGPCVFRYNGARGKLLSLSVDGLVAGVMEPEGVLSAGLLQIGLGLADPVEGLEKLSHDMEWPAGEDFPPNFDPSGEAEKLPVPEEIEEPEEEEAEENISETPQEADSDVTGETAGEEAVIEEEHVATVQPLPERSRRRTAFYQRAQRMTRSFEETGLPAWQGWASGRRREPVRSTSLRTRRQWRYSMPPVETAEGE